MPCEGLETLSFELENHNYHKQIVPCGSLTCGNLNWLSLKTLFCTYHNHTLFCAFCFCVVLDFAEIHKQLHNLHTWTFLLEPLPPPLRSPTVEASWVAPFLYSGARRQPLRPHSWPRPTGHWCHRLWTPPGMAYKLKIEGFWVFPCG